MPLPDMGTPLNFTRLLNLTFRSFPSVSVFTSVQSKCKAHFETNKDFGGGRVDFIAADTFAGKKAGYYFGRSLKGLNLGYHIDYAQMRSLMTLSPGDRCEARYQKVRRYFDGVICEVHVGAGVLVHAAMAWRW